MIFSQPARAAAIAALLYIAFCVVLFVKSAIALLRELIEHCMGFGLRGMECRYTGYDEEKVAYLEALAAEYGLIRTGGSDFHGSNKPHIHLGSGKAGELSVPYEFLQRLKERKKR